MNDYTTDQIRNIALVGHGGSGKTTLAEQILFKAGRISRPGVVEEGNTVCDHEPEEKRHGHSLAASLVHFDHEGNHVNLIDTPGYPDFLGQSLPVLPAVETVFVVIDAAKGVQMVDRRMMRVAAERRLPRVIVINKIDHENLDLEGLLEDIRETFGAVCLPINLPANGATEVRDVFEHEEGSSDIDFSSVAEAHTRVVDQTVEVDEALMSAYLEKGSVEPAQLIPAFKKSMREAHLVPVIFCSARTGAGVDELMHLMAGLCPSPAEGNPRPFELTDEDGSVTEWHADPKNGEATVAHVFHVASDPFVGKLTMFKVHQGSVKAGTTISRNDEKKPFRVGHVFRLHGKDHVDIDEAIAGDIAAISKVEDVRYDDVLHEAGHFESLHLKPLALPKPMFGLAIEAKSRNDEQKLSTAIHRLMEEDPTLVVERVPATKQTVARGLGELHLRIALEKMKERYHAEVTTAPPRVAYKETIAASAEGHHRHKKQTGGAGQFGEVYLRVEPLANGSTEPYEFVNETVGGSIPRQFMPAIEKGVRQVLETGAIAGYPLSGVRVAVYDGKHHPVDSKEVAFTTAGKKAFIDAVQKASPVLLEPFVQMEVTAPASHMGDLTADISGKRGRVSATDVLPGDMCLVKAEAPLSEVMNFTSELKSITGGAGSFTMEYSHDEKAPPNVQAEVVAAYKPHEDDED